MRRVGGEDQRNRFLYHVPWLVVRAGMNWDRWGKLQENLQVCERWFEEDPCWMRSFQVWRLVHQMAAYTQHPELKRAREVWKERMKELDEGEISDREAARKLVTRIAAGLTAGELKRIRRLCKNKPNWRYNPEALRTVRMIDGRFGKTHSAA